MIMFHCVNAFRGTFFSHWKSVVLGGSMNSMLGLSGCPPVKYFFKLQASHPIFSSGSLLPLFIHLRQQSLVVN